MSRAVVDAKEFSHAMSKISKILKKCAIPILEEVCLRIQNGRCTLTATDLETWLTAELPASGDDMFFVFRKTKDILRACSHFAGELTMEFSETRSGSKKAGKVLLRCERRGAEFEVYDGADYRGILRVGILRDRPTGGQGGINSDSAKNGKEQFFEKDRAVSNHQPDAFGLQVL